MNNKTKVLFGTRKHFMIVLGWDGEEKFHWKLEMVRIKNNNNKKIKSKIIC